MTADEFSDWLAHFHWIGACAAPPGAPPLVMGVLNATPDSFSDGGKFLDPSAATDHALAMQAAGADLLDIGGESTRPGSLPVDPQEQIRRVIPVLTAIRERSSIAVSIDTTSALVATAALDAGANIINDISAGRDDPALLSVAARRRAPIILMHMQGTPATMQVNPTYSDVVAEVTAFLRERSAAAVDAGIEPQQVLLDPGIGFGKTLQHNLSLLANLPTLAQLGHPLLVGTSRKGFVRKLAQAAGPTLSQSDAALFGTAATVAWATANGAAVLRVHDVGPMAAVVGIVRAVVAAK